MPHPSQQSRRSLKRITLAAGLTVAAIATSLVPTSHDRAEAATVGVLCTGFGPCTDANMSASGYHSVWNTMFWGMYSGQNCTNYVAYRMIKAGMPSARPAQLRPGKGNASYWGGSFGSLTNRVPTVGAVAWWNANVPGAGSGGHVAYVEKVYSASDIVVSESNWAGKFDWRRITTAANWPSGFIHLRDSGTPPPPPPPPPPTTTPTPPPVTTGPVNIAAPTVSGTAAAGQTLRANPGSWSQRDVAFAYQWYGDGAALNGETGSTIAIGKSKVGERISVKVTATNSAGATSVMSTATAAVVAGTIAVTTPPRITGTVRIGETLTAVPPVTSHALTSSSVQWYADGQPIAGATGWTLTLGPDQVAHRISVQVSGSRTAYNDLTVASATTELVQAPQLQVTSPGGVRGDALVGSAVIANPGATAPVTGQPTYAWLRDGQPIVGASAPTYTLTAADVAHHIAVRVGVNARGYFPMTRDYPLAEPITAPVKLKVRATGGHRSARVVVKVKSFGQLIRGGHLTARVGKHRVEAKVHGKRLVLRLHGVPTGHRTLKIQYDGTKRYEDAKTRERLRISR